MPSLKADLFLHPIRLRIITAISSHRMTTKEISQMVSDIPMTTLYRNINALAEGGIIQVVEENQVRGTVERVYALSGIPSLNAEDLSDMTKADCEQAFTTYLSTLMSDANRYLDGKSDGEKINIIQDGVVISKIEVFLSQEERQVMNEQIQNIIVEAGKNETAPNRKRHVFTYVMIPLES